MKVTKTMIIAGVAMIAVGLAGGLLILSRDTKSPQIVVDSTPIPSPTFNLLTWEDPAGFSIQYPEGLTIDKNEEDEENYAHLEFTHPDHPGSLIIWVSDTLASNIDEWLTDSTPWNDGIAIDTMLDKTPAKKIKVTQPARLGTATVSDGLLFLIDTTPEDEVYWSQVHEAVSGSFTFIPLPGEEPASVEEAAPEVSVDDEEVLE